ncbi:MAG: DUF6106 family protein [Lachnospiraceae bacterium]
MMQQSCYGECTVRRSMTMSSIIAKVMMYVVMVTSFLAMIVFFGFGEGALTTLSFVFFIIALVLIIYLAPRFDIEWEYIFVDGQLDFDQMLGGNARKNKDRIDFEKTEIVAPTGSYHLDNFKNIQMKTLDYSSLVNDNTYTIICHKDDQMVRILFEPDENMVSLMKQKSPRKVFTD